MVLQSEFRRLLSFLKVNRTGNSLRSHAFHYTRTCVICQHVSDKYSTDVKIKTVNTRDIFKAIPITGLCGPEGSGRLRLQISRHSAHEGGNVATLTHRPPLPLGISWYSFLEAESTPEHKETSAATELIPSLESIPGPSDL